MAKLHGKLQRLLAVLMSLMMALVLLAPSAFAADGSATITINGSGIKKDLKGMTVKAYMVLDQVNPDETTAGKKQYEVTEAFKPFFAMRDGENKLVDNVKNLFGQADQDVVLEYKDNKISFSALTTVNTAPAGSIVLTNTDAAQLDETYPEADLVSRLSSNSEAAATFYTWVEKYIEKSTDPNGDGTLENPTWANPQEKTYEEGGTSIQFTGLNEGYYALIFSGVPNGVSVKQGILIATNGNGQNGASMDLKAEEIPLTKKVKNPSTSHNGEDYSDNTTANMGDILDYEITSQVPTLTDADNLTKFNLSDTMQKQKLTGTMTLKLKKDNDEKTFTATVPAAGSGNEMFKASISSQTVNIAKLTVQAYTNGAQTFKVDFLDGTNNAWKDYQGYSITLTYQATLTADAYQINGNKVTLNFTNNGDDSTQEANTEVYTYGIEVQKTFSDGSDKYTGVEFKLYAADKDTGNQTETVIELVGDDGVYHKKDAVETGTAADKLVLDDNGKLTITGLDEGTYWLEETLAPAGFTEAEPIEIVLKADGNDKKFLDADASTAKYNGTGNDDLLTTKTEQANTSISLGQFKVYNQKGFTLPQTGGAGTWMFTVGGIVLIAAAGALFLASRKKRSSK